MRKNKPKWHARLKLESSRTWSFKRRKKNETQLCKKRLNPRTKLPKSRSKRKLILRKLKIRKSSNTTERGLRRRSWPPLKLRDLEMRKSLRSNAYVNSKSVPLTDKVRLMR